MVARKTLSAPVVRYDICVTQSCAKIGKEAATVCVQSKLFEYFSWPMWKKFMKAKTLCVWIISLVLTLLKKKKILYRQIRCFRVLQNEKRLDLGKIIERSLQRSASLVRDKEEYKSRSTERVKLILSILHEKANAGNKSRYSLTN